MDTSQRNLHATIVALFPEIVTHACDASILGRAARAGTLCVQELQLRDFALDKHRKVDDTPSGGGPGLVMKIDVVTGALRAALRQDEAAHGPGRRRRIVMMDAGGARFTQDDARRLATYDHLVLLCGRYEGIDARVHEYVDERISIGDFVLTGGELAAAVVLDATAREVAGVLGNDASRDEESHSAGRLEYRQYTRPNLFEGRGVPEVLLGGDHGRIAKARAKDGLRLTQSLRPDLLATNPLTTAEEKLLQDNRIPTLEPVRALFTSADPGEEP
jgi:tRNA (guanine37-N1)-methyltransferase